MSLLFALVARGSIVLAEHDASKFGNSYAQGKPPAPLATYKPCSTSERRPLTPTSPATQTILSKIPSSDSKLSYAAENILIHYQKTNDVVTMCVAEDSAGRRIPFAFLAELMRRFNAAYSEIGDAPAYGMNSFEGDIAKLMVRPSRPSYRPLSRR